MIKVGCYYRNKTNFGVRTLKAVQDSELSDVYGIFSASNCKNPKNSQCMIIPNNSPKATSHEIKE
jgi:hypothetical protein